MDHDKAIRAAKLTLGAVLDKRRAQTARDRAGGQIAPSKYLPGVPRQFHAYGGRANEKGNIWWHGSPSGDLRGGTSGLHLGTKAAALDALRARIGVPADGSMWDGTKEYGKTLLAGRKTLNRMGKYLISGHNVDAPEEDYYPHQHPRGMPTVGNGVPVDPSWKPFLRPFRIVGSMTNTPWSPHGDSRANSMMKASLTKGNAKNGYYYTNDGEDSGSISAVVPNGSHVEPVDQDSKYADGGVADDDNQPVDLGAAREQKQLQGFHKGLMGDMASAAAERMDAHQKAIDAGVFDGYEVGDTLQGSVHPMRITGRFVRPWKPSIAVLSHFDRVGAKPTIIEHNGKQYIPMLRYQTGKEGTEGWQEGDSYLDMVKQLGYRKMGGLRAVKADGGSLDSARRAFLAGNHPEVPPVVYHGTNRDFGSFQPLSHFGTQKAAHERLSAENNWSKPARADETPSVIPVHISMKKPLDLGVEAHPSISNENWLDDADMLWQVNRVLKARGHHDAADKIETAANDAMDNDGLTDETRKFAADAIRSAGYDGLMYTNKVEDRGSRSFVTLGPEQVKSAIGNRGTFDPTNPDMTYADGGVVDDGDEDITAYHGSPHDFDAFDIGKIGTGEGAQSYGHGLYFAGNEGVAKSYRNALSDTLIHPEGTPDLEKRAAQMALTFSDNTPSGALQWLSKFKNGATHTSPAMTPELVAAVSNKFASGEFRPGGHMYKVKLRAKPHELLDWDKPLSQQHPNVQAAIKAIGVDTGAREWKDGADLGSGNRLVVTPHPDLPDEEQFAKYEMETPTGARIKLHRQDVERLLGKGGDLTGAQIHHRLVDMGNRDGAIGEHLRADNPMKTGPKWVAEQLMRHGIKGIRYRDAMSRNKEDGDATHNYVMFHHDPVKVVDKYEYGGAVGKSEGGSMGDDESRPVDLGVTRALRRFNQDGDGPTSEAEGVFNRLATARDAAASAHEEAIKDGVFNSAQIGDVFKYKPLDTYAPMKVVDHGMVHISRWGGINPPKYVYQDHFPVAEVQYQDASKERRKFPIELLEDRDRYDFLSGKPRIARADGGRLSLYSKAAQIIRGMKDQPMQAADIVKYALGKGAKRTEIAHVDVPPGKATPSQVAEHIEFMQPQIGVHKREMFYRYNDPERYERQINYLEGQGRHDEAEELNREFEAFEGYGGKDAPIYAKYQLPGGENYREHVLTLDDHPDDQTYTAPIHWGKLKNPLAHIRMSTRIIGNRKILHIEEMQSDWNNDARKVGFRTGREKQDYEDYVAQMRQKAIDKVKARTGQDYYDPTTGETAPTMSPMVAQAQIEKYQRVDPYTLALKMGVMDEHRQMANAAKGGSGVPRAPYINPEKDDVYEMAMKHVLMEAAKGGYDGIAFTPDEEQELRWPGHTFKGIYNKRLPGIAQRLVQPHDTDANVDDMTRLNGWAVPMIPLSDKARDSITQNGFSSFRRGGAVGYEDGGSVTPDIQNPMSIFPKPQRMFPEDQRPAGGQYLSMPSKTDVTGHKAEAATIGVAPGGKPFFRASQNAVDQTGSTGRGTATAKTNLFKQKAGWRWAQAPEGHEATDTIVSVEHRGKHYYTLNAHFPKGVDLARYENAPSEPRLRPTTRGNVEIGPQAGSILVRGREHPVYHHVIVKADGGAVDAALAATRRFTKDGQHVTMRLKD